MYLFKSKQFFGGAVYTSTVVNALLLVEGNVRFMNPIVPQNIFYFLFKFWLAFNEVFSAKSACVNGSGSLAVFLFLLSSSETHYHADVRDMLRGRLL